MQSTGCPGGGSGVSNSNCLGAALLSPMYWKKKNPGAGNFLTGNSKIRTSRFKPNAPRMLIFALKDKHIFQRPSELRLTIAFLFRAELEVLVVQMPLKSSLLERANVLLACEQPLWGDVY